MLGCCEEKQDTEMPFVPVRAIPSAANLSVTCADVSLASEPLQDRTVCARILPREITDLHGAEVYCYSVWVVLIIGLKDESREAAMMMTVVVLSTADP